MGRSDSDGRGGAAEWAALALLAVFTLLAIGGYGVFGRNPHLIPDSDGARRFYGLSFPLFARVHILLAGAVLALPLLRRARRAWIPAFLLVFGVSFLSEFIGTGYGFPFGGYAYTSLLGLKLGGRVPAVIPLSWFLMTVPSWVVAHTVLPGKTRRLGRIVLGAYLLTAWDLALDPAMSHLTPYWVWNDAGPFYGMPWVNLLGWLGTGMVLMALMEALGSEEWAGSLPLPWMAAYYGVILLMPLGMVAVAGLWGAVLATGLALLPVWGLYRGRSARRSPAMSPALASERGLP